MQTDKAGGDPVEICLAAVADDPAGVGRLPGFAGFIAVFDGEFLDAVRQFRCGHAGKFAGASEIDFNPGILVAVDRTPAGLRIAIHQHPGNIGGAMAAGGGGRTMVGDGGAVGSGQFVFDQMGLQPADERDPDRLGDAHPDPLDRRCRKEQQFAAADRGSLGQPEPLIVLAAFHLVGADAMAEAVFFPQIDAIDLLGAAEIAFGGGAGDGSRRLVHGMAKVLLDGGAEFGIALHVPFGNRTRGIGSAVEQEQGTIAGRFHIDPHQMLQAFALGLVARIPEPVVVV